MTDLFPAFAQAMQALGPFESSPTFAVALSGGPDSMALAWLAQRLGRVVALTVDHRLRPDSTAEAAQVASWMQMRGIEHHILTWEHGELHGNLQSQAATARYALLTEWCRKQGILHLLLGHHRDDQAETVLFRQARGSGGWGLAGMSARRSQDGVQWLRPLLAMPKQALVNYLKQQNLPWIDDPSNRSMVYARNRLRADMTEAMAQQALAISQEQAQRRRVEEPLAALALAESVTLHAAGYAVLDPQVLRQAPEAMQLRALSALITCIDGDDYPPRFETVERFYREWFRPGMAGIRDIGRCLCIPSKDKLLVGRDPAQVEGPLPLEPGQTYRWDRRFTVQVSEPGWQICALGNHRLPSLPAKLSASLPSLRHLDSGIFVPHIQQTIMHNAFDRFAFTPRRPLADAAFTCAGSFPPLC